MKVLVSLFLVIAVAAMIHGCTVADGAGRALQHAAEDECIGVKVPSVD